MSDGPIGDVAEAIARECDARAKRLEEDLAGEEARFVDPNAPASLSGSIGYAADVLFVKGSVAAYREMAGRVREIYVVSKKRVEAPSAREVKPALHGAPGNRAEEPGWVVAAFHDPSERRGLWFREGRDPSTEDARLRLGRLVKLEVCAGREGDDDYVLLQAGQTLDGETLSKLADALTSAAWMVREAGIVDEDDRVVAWKSEPEVAP